MGTCFVVMGFGTKTDYQSGRVLNLDASYQNLIKPAVLAAGLQCIRADEIVHSGIIDVPMYEQLLMADVVVADVSTMNPNAFYELGVRHALKPFTTIIVSESELKFPFDIGHSAIRKYKHLGDDIGVSEARRFTGELTSAIREILKQPADDSPVYTFLRLNPPSRIQEQIAAIKAGAGQDTPKPAADTGPDETLRFALNQAAAARKSGNWAVAKFMLEQIRDSMRKTTASGAPAVVDPYILQQLALATYKADGTVEGLKAACAVMEELSPVTSNDPETLGIWGAIHKRLWEKSGDRGALDDAIVAYERGFNLRNDYYNGINYAFLLNVRCSVTTGDEAVADRVIANRIRKQVVIICEKLAQDADVKQADKYWALATIAEANFGLGKNAEFEAAMSQASAIAPESWMAASTREQIAKLASAMGVSAPPASAGL